MYRRFNSKRRNEVLELIDKKNHETKQSKLTTKYDFRPSKLVLSVEELKYQQKMLKSDFLYKK